MSTTPVRTDIVKSLINDPDFDDRVQYKPGTEPTEDSDPSGEFNPDEMYFSQGGGDPDPNDCGCSMCCGTHIVVNCMGQQRPCDYCECDI